MEVATLGNTATRLSKNPSGYSALGTGGHLHAEDEGAVRQAHYVSRVPMSSKLALLISRSCYVVGGRFDMNCSYPYGRQSEQQR